MSYHKREVTIIRKNAANAAQVPPSSYGERVTSSVSGAIFGAVLVLGSSGMLWWNEHHAASQANALSQIKKEIKVVQEFAEENEGKIICYTGKLNSSSPVRDEELEAVSERTSEAPPPYNPQDAAEQAGVGVGAVGESPGFFRLERSVAMYQWKEEAEVTESREQDGEKVKIVKDTKYVMTRDWANKHISSQSFNRVSHRENVNPPLHVSHRVWHAPTRVGPFDIKQALLNGIPNNNAPATIQAIRYRGRVVVKKGDWFWIVKSQPHRDTVGDTRVRYQGLGGDVAATIVGTQRGRRVVAIRTDGSEQGMNVMTNGPWLRAGRVGHLSILEGSGTGNSALLWFLRLLGSVLTYGGFKLLFAPIVQLSSFNATLSSFMQLLTNGTLVIPLSMSFSSLTMGSAWVHARSKYTVVKLFVALGYFAAMLGSLLSVYRLNKYLLQRAGSAASAGAHKAQDLATTLFKWWRGRK